jgi:hypothetical protein
MRGDKINWVDLTTAGDRIDLIQQAATAAASPLPQAIPVLSNHGFLRMRDSKPHGSMRLSLFHD